MITPVHVQIVSASEERRERWRIALAAAAAVVDSTPLQDGTELPDVMLSDSLGVVSDSLSNLDGRRRFGCVRIAASDEEFPASLPVALAEHDPPTITLPASASPREVALACVLVGQIVRLQRVAHDGNHREDHWRQLAATDPLTGMLNRRAFGERIAEICREAEGEGVCCLAMIDLDRFKSINDELGHLAGDSVLQGAAARLASAVRRDDLVARFGGDEFAIALVGVRAELAGKLVDRIRRAVETDLAVGEAKRRLTASAGWAMLERPVMPNTIDAQRIQQALQRADERLLQAKSAGRDRTIP